jgi:hypothetical protein
LIIRRYIGSLNGCVGSDVYPENWPKILELIQAEKTVGWQDKKLMEESTHRYMNSPPMDLIAMFDEFTGTVNLTLGRRSYEMSEKLRWIGCKTVPDSNYLKYEFQIRNEQHSINYVRVHLKALASESKWQLHVLHLI